MTPTSHSPDGGGSSVAATAETIVPTEAAPVPHPQEGWRTAVRMPSLPEVYSTVPVPVTASFGRKLLAFAGPGLMVAVGYMDPGNWATDLAGGAQFGYTLLTVVLISNFMAILLQHLALKLGVVAGRDLAQACRDHYSWPVTIFLWVLCEIAIAACDLAEVIGSAIALNLLFGIPLVVGVVVTALDVLVVLFLQSKGFRYVECLVSGLIAVIGGCFAYELVVSNPSIAGMLGGLLPSPQVVVHPGMLYIAVGILGATVMPHNLYLHSSIVQTRAFERTESGRAMAIKFATIDSTVSLLFAFFINAAILVLSAATFHGTQHQDVADIADAYKLLSPTLGDPLASILFAIALLASGQNSTLTGTMAGQIVMEGFLNIRLRPWIRRLLTRIVAIGPAVVVAGMYGESGVGKLLILSQVILSLQLSFAVVPLVLFTCDRMKMGRFVNTRGLAITAWFVTFIIVSLNLYLLGQTLLGWLGA
ncbi:MAG: Nramp family divalent metal transporter [Candidatus Hydrogenedentes bacterium]|nr:Nramp family divalent metal transporter [Candidatus Hydrogenedentota bacterium]